MHVAEPLNKSLDALESLYNELHQVSLERDYLTNDEVGYVSNALQGAVEIIGAKPLDVVPSLESDNYFERNSVQVSMEAIGETIKSGVKAAIVALMNMIKNLCNRVAAHYKALPAKIAKLRSKANVVTQTIEKAKTQKTPQATAPAAPTSGEAEPATETKTPQPLVTKFHVTMTLLKFDDVADKVDNAAAMNTYITKLATHLNALVRDFSSRMDYGSETNNFAVDSMKALQNVTVSDTPVQILVDVSRDAAFWERWTKTTLPFLERTFQDIAKKDVQVKMQTHLTAAERATNTEKDETKLGGYRQRINELGKMIKTFDMILAGISSVDIKPVSTPPPNPSAT